MSKVQIRITEIDSNGNGRYEALVNDVVLSRRDLTRDEFRLLLNDIERSMDKIEHLRRLATAEREADHE